ncbi:L-lactate MFS transporter [Leptolyngbya sp. AN03gr2]|uniref:L-lactate MFS transporter n=1 Tax=unclassified Leptolyngbya TaxID=2650499 RepID=UPI003D3184B4
MNNVTLFGMPAEKGRWLFIPLGILALLCLGTVYSWSIFRTPLQTLLKINATESLLPFTILLVVFAILMPIAGFLIERYGVRLVTAVGGIITGLGYVLSGLDASAFMLVITYGVITGAGIGIVYGVPLAVSAKWFPDKKGIAVGTTVIGFGLSPLVTAPIARNLIATYGVRQSFIILGTAFAAIIVLISFALKMPPAGWTPSGWTPSTKTIATQGTKMLGTQTFNGLWICYTIGTFVGLAAIGISSPVAQEIVKLDKVTADATVSLFAVFNGLGRPLFGWLSDRVSTKQAAIVSYVLILIASILMINAQAGQVASYLIAFCLFWLCLGGWLAIAPTATATLFDANNYAKNYGIVFTAYGVGAVLGTVLAGRIKDTFGSYTLFFYPTAILAIVGIIVATFMLKRPSRAVSEQDRSVA